MVTYARLVHYSLYFEEGGLAALSDWVDAVGVEASWGGDGGVVVDPRPAVHSPVVVAVVVDVAVAVVHQAVLAHLLGQSSIRALCMILFQSYQ